MAEGVALFTRAEAEESIAHIQCRNLDWDGVKAEVNCEGGCACTQIIMSWTPFFSRPHLSIPRFTLSNVTHTHTLTHYFMNNNDYLHILQRAGERHRVDEHERNGPSAGDSQREGERLPWHGRKVYGQKVQPARLKRKGSLRVCVSV